MTDGLIERVKINHLTLSIFGGIFALFGALFTARIVWEETALTLQQGPQMVGFSLAHGSCAVLLLAPFVLAIWLVLAVVIAILDVYKKRTGSRTVYLLIGVSVLELTLVSMPDAFWQWSFVDTFAKSPHVADLITYAAAEGNSKTVRAYLSHGVPLEARNYEGSTAAFTAAAAGSVEVLELLADRGADLSATNLYGDSPLEVAIDNKRDAAVTYLRMKNAKQVRGSEEQHQAASETIVERQMKSLNH